jgi:hypothetical protein
MGSEPSVLITHNLGSIRYRQFLSWQVGLMNARLRHKKGFWYRADSRMRSLLNPYLGIQLGGYGELAMHTAVSETGCDRILMLNDIQISAEVDISGLLTVLVTKESTAISFGAE